MGGAPVRFRPAVFGPARCDIVEATPVWGLPVFGCDTEELLDNAAEVAGKVVVFRRGGGIDYLQKAVAAERAGAVAVIVINDVDRLTTPALPSNRSVRESNATEQEPSKVDGAAFNGRVDNNVAEQIPPQETEPELGPEPQPQPETETETETEPQPEPQPQPQPQPEPEPETETETEPEPQPEPQPEAEPRVSYRGSEAEPAAGQPSVVRVDLQEERDDTVHPSQAKASVIAAGANGAAAATPEKETQTETEKAPIDMHGTPAVEQPTTAGPEARVIYSGGEVERAPAAGPAPDPSAEEGVPLQGGQREQAGDSTSAERHTERGRERSTSALPDDTKATLCNCGCGVEQPSPLNERQLANRRELTALLLLEDNPEMQEVAAKVAKGTGAVVGGAAGASSVSSPIQIHHTHTHPSALQPFPHADLKNPCIP